MPHTPDATPASAGERGRSDDVRRGTWMGLDHGSLMGVELVVGVVLYAGVGHLVDRWLGTAPWFLLVGSLLGFAAGLYLIWVRSARMEREERARLDASRQPRTGSSSPSPADAERGGVRAN